MEVRTPVGLVRKGQNVESVITKQMESGSLPKVAVCPRVVRLDNPGKTSRVPVRFCNISARVVTMTPKANASCLVLPCSLSMCFVCPFSILITLLKEEGAGLRAYRAFVC